MGEADNPLVNWLRVAEGAARAGGSVVESTFDAVVLSDAGRDIKLDVDYDAEERIIAVLRQHSGAAILSEERGLITGTLPPLDLRWIIDPLDGSFNYWRKIPFCCVSVALWRNDAPLVGAIYDFNRQEMFSAIVGSGAWVNGVPVAVSRVPARSRAVLATGFPVGADLGPDAVRAFIEHVASFKKLRLLGSAALSLAYVASGRMDAYYEEGIRLWDVAAGLALVSAAGGSVVCPRISITEPMVVYADNACLSREELSRGPGS